MEFHSEVPAPPPPAPGGKLPDCAGMKALRESGWSYADIELEYGVSNQSVARKYRDCGLSEQRTDYTALIPRWDIQIQHRSSNIHRLLRQAARIKAGDDSLQLSAAKMRELMAWTGRLEREGLVVDYDPATGYSLVPKIEADEWYVRWPENL